MVMDTMPYIERYTGLGKRIAQGLKALRETDFSAMEDGKYDIDGEDIFALVSTYSTKPAAEARPEAHIKYIDIQRLISGRELIGVAPLDDLGEPVEDFPDRDIRYYDGKTALIPLEGEIFHIYFPQDAHAPCIAADGSEKVRKVLIKVRY